MRNKLSITIILLLIAATLNSQDVPAPMHPFKLVNDFANLFSSSELYALENKLLSYNDTTSTQIYVVTINDLGGYPVSDYAFVLGEKWGIGQSGKDNGLLILIKPKVGNSRGQAFVATGYGLETFITDAFAGRIVRDYMIPYFKNDDYFGGVNAAIDVITSKLSGEFNADHNQLRRRVPTWLIVLIFIIAFISITSSSGGNHNNRGGGRPTRPPIFFPPNSGGGFGRGGGTFRGGGGGRFGGGGAGGSW